MNISSNNNTNDSSSYCALSQNGNLLHIACANASSLVEKIDSLICLFDNNQLHLAFLTETWLTNRTCPPRTMSDLTAGANLSFVRRDRGSRGGGVAVCYNPTKIRMNKFKFTSQYKEAELVCAIGNCQLTKRKIAALSIYLPPSLKAGELAGSIQALTDCVDQVLTKHPGALVVLGGDFNGKDLSAFCSAHATVKPIGSGASRGNTFLDEIYTNLSENIVEKLVQEPLSKPNGVLSDHTGVGG